MPIFDYRCQDCLEEFEYFTASPDAAPICPCCTGTRLIKQASGFAVGTSNSKDPSPAEHATEESGHTCSSSCNHGSDSHDHEHKHDHSQGPHAGCARSYADSLREKYR